MFSQTMCINLVVSPIRWWLKTLSRVTVLLILLIIHFNKNLPNFNTNIMCRACLVINMLL